jgi:sec-independent protein translocase protein TatC
VLALLGCWVLAWLAEPTVREFLTSKANAAINSSLQKGQVYKEVLFNVPSAFMIQFKLSFALALLAAFPFITYQLWAFIAPGLKPSEQKPFKRLVPYSIGLFVVGAMFGWFVLPSTYAWFASYTANFKNTEIIQEVGSMAIFSLKMLIAFGVGFQLPLIVYILGALNLLSAATLMKYWRHASVAIFTISAAITPSADIPTMLALAIPLTALFMLSAFLVKIAQRKKGPENFLWADETEKVIPATVVDSVTSSSDDWQPEYDPYHAQSGAVDDGPPMASSVEHVDKA